MLYDLDPCPETIPDRVRRNDDNHHFVKLVLTHSRLRLRAESPGGRVIDRMSLRN